MRLGLLRGVLVVLPLAGTLLAGAHCFAAAPVPVNPTVEAQNFSKGTERQTVYLTPQYQALLRTVSNSNLAAAVAIQAADPGREFASDLCWNGEDGCAGDARLYDWQSAGDGIVDSVLFTARDGATLSGHVWATRSGPARRPGIVLVGGSVQANEPMYWFIAQVLAKDGYVVLTYDPQGQGQSDTVGEAPDEGEGVPAQTDGRPFYDGSEDALNFFLSTPAQPYVPVPSCTTGTSHAAKHTSRSAAGLDSASNPLWSMIDPARIGMAGASLGAAAVSYVGQHDPRVKAIVAYDNLQPPDANTPDPLTDLPYALPCPAAPSARSVPPVTKPALAMSADYFVPPTPNATAPDPLAKSQESLAYTRSGVDTGEIIIRGGTHYEFDWAPDPAFPATLRGADEIDWYTTAWFDKYVKGDPTADARLLTNRWRHDGREGAVDPNQDANDYSFYYLSRLDFHEANGTPFDCEDLRTGCSGLTDADGYEGDYSYLNIATAKDAEGATSTTTSVAVSSAGSVTDHPGSVSQPVTRASGPLRGAKKPRVVRQRTPTATARSPQTSTAPAGASTSLAVTGMSWPVPLGALTALALAAMCGAAPRRARVSGERS